MSDLYFNGESDCFNEYTYDNEVFWSTIFQPFQIEPGQKKTSGNESSHEKETKHINASAANLLHIRIENLDRGRREASYHPVFMGICPTISYMC